MDFIFSKEIKKNKNNNLPIIELESTIIAHGMPYPENLLFAKNIELNCRKKGVAPATIAVLDGRVHIGLTNKELKSFESLDKLKNIICQMLVSLL